MYKLQTLEAKHLKTFKLPCASEILQKLTWLLMPEK